MAISGPRLSYSAFMNAAESSLFWESLHTAQEMVKAGQGEELFTSKFPFPLLITAAGYIDKYGPAERYNILKFAAELPCPYQRGQLGLWPTDVPRRRSDEITFLAVGAVPIHHLRCHAK